MSPAMLKWVAGVASVLCVMAVVTMLNMWSDLRIVKGDLAAQKEALASQVKAERIATLEAQVKALEATDLKHDNSISALWRVRGGRREEPG